MPNQYTREPYPIRTCLRCGQEFEHRRRDSFGKYCSRTCSDQINHNPPAQPWIPTPCLYCGESFLCPPWRPEIKHCSNKCSKRTRAKTVVGEHHPLWKPKTPMACEVCGTVRMVKPSLVSRFRSCSRRCNALLALRTFPRISSLERIMSEAFTNAQLTPTAQHWVGPYVVDFAFIDEKLAVACDGSYWHSLPGQPAKDRKKDGYLKKSGWQIVRLAEDAIKASPNDCLNQVMATLHGLPLPLLAEALPLATPESA